MSVDYPVLDDHGRVQLSAVIGHDGELHLILGRAEEPGVAELFLAITAVADAANAHDGDDRGAWADLYGAVEALHLAGRVGR